MQKSGGNSGKKYYTTPFFSQFLEFRIRELKYPTILNFLKENEERLNFKLPALYGLMEREGARIKKQNLERLAEVLEVDFSYFEEILDVRTNGERPIERLYNENSMIPFPNRKRIKRQPSFYEKTTLSLIELDPSRNLDHLCLNLDHLCLPIDFYEETGYNGNNGHNGNRKKS